MTDLEIECTALTVQDALRYIASLDDINRMTAREALGWAADLFVKALDAPAGKEMKRHD